MYSRSDSNSVWARLPCCLSKGPPKEDFLDNYLTTFFRVGNLGNTSAMPVMFFWKCSKFNIDFKDAKVIREKEFFKFNIDFENAKKKFGCVKLSH